MPNPNFLDMARQGVPVDDETYNALQAASRQSVPTGVEGDTRSELQRYYDAFDQPDPRDRLNRSLLKYGNSVLIPPVEELPGSAIDALNTAGNIAIAYGPPNLGPAGPVAEAAGMILKAPKALISAGKGVERVASEDALAAEGARAARSVAARQAARAAERDARYAAANPNMGPTVPKIDGITPMRERNAVVDYLNGNPYVQPIPGRQGLPTKAEQLDLANRFFDRGGRLPEPGPWGRNMPEDVKSVLRGENSKAAGPTGRTQNRPGVPDMLDTIKKTNAQIEDLTKQLQTAKAGDIPLLQQQLRIARDRADQFTQLWAASKSGADEIRPVNPMPRPAPRVYRRGAE